MGLMEFHDKEMKLKPKRGKRLALRTSNQSTYKCVLEKAKEKWKNYNSDCFDEEKEYVLLYEDAQIAECLPGSSEAFILSRYKEELGKEYKRIILYLSTVDNYK